MVTKKQHEFKFTEYMEKGLEIQRWRNILEYSDSYMQERFRVSEDSLKRIYLGDVDESGLGRFTMVYYELRHDIDKYNKENNSKAMVKLLVNGDFYNKKVFYKLLRILIDYTQQELADTLDVSLSAIRAWEQGKSNATGGNRIVLYEMIPKNIREQAELRKLGETTKNNYSIELMDHTQFFDNHSKKRIKHCDPSYEKDRVNNNTEIISESNSSYSTKKNLDKPVLLAKTNQISRELKKVKVKNLEHHLNDGAAKISRISNVVSRMNQR